MTEPSELDDVLDAMTTLGTRSAVTCYVERRCSRYRWSVAHKGGPYPLLREVARFLDLPHTSLLIGTAAVEGWTVIAPSDDGRPDAWGFIEAGADKGILRDRITGVA